MTGGPTSSKKLLFFSCGIVFTLVILLSILFGSFVLISSRKRRIGNTNYNLYQLQEIRSFGHSTKSSFVRNAHKLEKEDFISYTSGDSVKIISNLASPQFECTGSCFCSQSERRTSISLTRSLIVLFSALSISVAYKIADTTFHEQCKNQYSEACDQENIKSEVTECVAMETKYINYNPPVTDTKAVRQYFEQTKKQFYDFECVGHCLRHWGELTVQDDTFYQKFVKEQGWKDCEDIEVMGDIYLKSPDSNPMRGKISGFELADSTMERACAYFRNFYLTPHCKHKSKNKVKIVHKELGYHGNDVYLSSFCTGDPENAGLDACENVICVPKGMRDDAEFSKKRTKKKSGRAMDQFEDQNDFVNKMLQQAEETGNIE